MRKLNLIVVFSADLDKVLFCIRAKEPYKGLYNFVGGKVENGETNDDAAYRELFEETGISRENIKLDHFMDLNYFKYENNLQVYYGILKHEVNLIEEKNKLEWVTINDELLNNSKFAGNYNIPHIIRQIKVYLKNGTEINKYYENIICNTPEQNMNIAHPSHDTHAINRMYQYYLILCKMERIMLNVIDGIGTPDFYSFRKFTKVLDVGLRTEEFERVSINDFDTVSTLIDSYY